MTKDRIALAVGQQKHIYVPESQGDNRCAICAHLPSASQHITDNLADRSSTIK